MNVQFWPLKRRRLTPGKITLPSAKFALSKPGAAAGGDAGAPRKPVPKAAVSIGQREEWVAPQKSSAVWSLERPVDYQSAKQQADSLRHGKHGTGLSHEIEEAKAPLSGSLPAAGREGPNRGRHDDLIRNLVFA
jgi:hypothetical protein